MKQIITLSDKAATRIKEVLSNDKNSLGVRIGVKSGGCAGMEYTMEFIDSPDPDDEIIESLGVKIAIAANAQMFLFGSEIDYETNILESGFKFRNPNVKESCGCGESIKF